MEEGKSETREKILTFLYLIHIERKEQTLWQCDFFFKLLAAIKMKKNVFETTATREVVIHTQAITILLLHNHTTYYDQMIRRQLFYTVSTTTY